VASPSGLLTREGAWNGRFRAGLPPMATIEASGR
jgi:hypothetical protein